MNRISKESLPGGRNIPAVPQHRRGRSFSGVSRDTDENLDLFSRNRRSLSIAPSDESDVSMKLGRISVGSAKLARSGMEDLLSSVDGGKHDYDWLLTPPGTPLFPSSDASEPRPTLPAPKSSSLVRSVSTTKASRLSVTHSENSYSSRPTRSSSVTRSSTTHYNTYSSNSNKSSSILNTSSASVTSSSRPSTPTTRSTLPYTARHSTPSARPSLSRSSTPSKSRPAPTNTSGDKARVSQNSRPSTPSARPIVPANLNSPSSRSNSRPSTPTRRIPTPAPVPAANRSTSVGRVLSNGRNPAPASRGSSPGPRPRPSQQPIVPPDFPHDTPPNLRTTLPDRPVSAGRSRPGIAVTVRRNSEAPVPVNPPRRQSSPIGTRGRVSEVPGRGHLHANGPNIGSSDSQKFPPVSEPSIRRPAKPTTISESTGFGRTISKKSMDMALRHMDIRHGTGSIRSLSGTTLFPQSVRSSTPKGHPARPLDRPISVSSKSHPPVSSNGAITGNGYCIDRSPDGEGREIDGRISAKLSEPDIYESSRYDAILLKEDLKNTNWLHSVDDKSDQGLIFDHRFEQLPEPFGLL